MHPTRAMFLSTLWFLLFTFSFFQVYNWSFHQTCHITPYRRRNNEKHMCVREIYHIDKIAIFCEFRDFWVLRVNFFQVITYWVHFSLQHDEQIAKLVGEVSWKSSHRSIEKTGEQKVVNVKWIYPIFEFLIVNFLQVITYWVSFYL